MSLSKKRRNGRRGRRAGGGEPGDHEREREIQKQADEK